MENSNRPYSLANPVVSAHLANIFNPKSKDFCSVQAFGEFLHMLEDSWSHGGAAPNWFGHPRGVAHKHRTLDTRNGVNHWVMKDWISQGWTDTRVDNVNWNFDSYVKMKKDVALSLLAFYMTCPCACSGKSGDDGKDRPLGQFLSVVMALPVMYVNMVTLDSANLNTGKKKE